MTHVWPCRMPLTPRWALTACALWLALTGVNSAQDSPPPPAENAATGAASEQPPADGVDLVAEQTRLAEQFERFETLLLRLAEVTAPTDPRRAALLRKAVARSKDKLIQSQFARLVELLDRQQTGLAQGQQQELVGELAQILDVLLSEDHQRQAQAERDRLAAYLKEVNRLIQEQQALQVQTQRAANPDETASRQGKLADKTGSLAEKIKADSPRPEAPADDERPGDEKQSSDKPAAEQAAPEKSGDPSPAGPSSEARDADPAAAPEAGDPTPDAPSAAPSDSEQSSETPAPLQPPPAGESPLRAAQRRMQQAQDRLREAQQQQALEEQEAALKELRTAKAELEKVLRQMREEELERMLVQLEERLRQMLKIQKEIETGTTRLAAIPPPERQRGDELDSGRLSRRQALLAVEAEKAQMILEEDGTSVAFVEVLTQVHDDMHQVADRLARFDVGELTQGVERDIIVALEEMLAALEKAQQERQDQKDQPMPNQQQADQPPRLVDRLAELKLIRSLQFRVNRRTQEIARLIDGPRTDQPELLEALRELALRQQRIYHSTRELALETGQ